MADVKWIKLCTDVFDDEKILLIESMPDCDSIIVIWFKLLCFAGKQNNGGVFMLNNKTAYTDEMLASIFRRPINTVRLALSTFENFGMIEIISNTYTIPNWEKHQNVDKMEEIREYNRLKQRESRAKKKLLQGVNDNVNDKSMTSQPCQDIDIDKDIDKDLDKDIELENNISTPPATKHKYGEHKNVLLTDEEYKKLQERFPTDYEDKINTLSEGLALKGYKYKSHYLAVLKWAKNDESKPKKTTSSSNPFLELLKEG